MSSSPRTCSPAKSQTTDPALVTSSATAPRPTLSSSSASKHYHLLTAQFRARHIESCIAFFEIRTTIWDWTRAPPPQEYNPRSIARRALIERRNGIAVLGEASDEDDDDDDSESDDEEREGGEPPEVAEMFRENDEMAVAGGRMEDGGTIWVQVESLEEARTVHRERLRAEAAEAAARGGGREGSRSGAESGAAHEISPLEIARSVRSVISIEVEQRAAARMRANGATRSGGSGDGNVAVA